MNETVQILLIALAIAGPLLGGFFLVRARLDRRGGAIEARLKADREPAFADAVRPLEAPRGLMDRVDLGFNRMVQRSGLRMRSDQALAVITGIAIGAAGLLYLWREELWLALLGLVLGLLIPLGVFWFLQARWRRQMQEQMPDVFYSLSRSLRAGLSLEQALAQVGNLPLQPLCGELKRCAEQLSLGISVPVALQLAAQRVNLPDFNVFTSVVSLHRQIGGNLGLMLDRLAASTRDRNLYMGYFRSTTILGRITAIVIGLAVPLIFLYYALFQPDYVERFFATPGGVISLVVAAMLEIIGIVWLYFLMKVDY